MHWGSSGYSMANAVAYVHKLISTSSSFLLSVLKPALFPRKQPKQTAVGVQVDLFLGPAEPATSPPRSPSHRTSPPNFSTPKPALAADSPPPSGVDTTQTITGSTMSGAGQESRGSSPKAATLDYHDLTLTSEPAEKVRAKDFH